MIRKLLAFVFLVLLSVGTQAATLSVATDNIVAINPNTAVTVTANISKGIWLINTGTATSYINVWGNTATSSSRKLLPNRVYEIRMDYDQFSILGTATENITIIQKKSTDGRDLIGGAYIDRLNYGAVTDNAIVRFDGTSGMFIQGSLASVDDSGNLSANQYRAALNKEALSANKTIAATDPQYQFLDPNGANRDVTLPSGVTGMVFIIKNTGTGGYVLTVKDSGGTAITGGAIANGIVMGFLYDGAAWQIV